MTVWKISKFKDLYGKPCNKHGWMAKVVSLIQMLLTFGGCCNCYPCKNLSAIAPRSRRDDRDRGAMAAIAARLCISRRDLD